MNLLFIQRFLAQISCVIQFIVPYWRKKSVSQQFSDLRQEQAGGEALTVPLSQVFPEIEELASHDEMSVKADFKNDFDLEHFRQLMARDNLRFQDEQSDVLELFKIADEKKWTWFETYQWPINS